MVPLNLQGQEQEFKLNEEEQLLIINRLHQVLRPFLLRRVKSEVAKEIPDKKEITLKVELTEWQTMVYKQLSEKCYVSEDKKPISNIVMQLRKICNHPYLFLDYQNYENLMEHIISSSGKFEVLDRIVPKLLAFKHKILIFSQMTKLLDILEIFFQKQELEYLRLDGATKTEIREDLIKKFTDPNSPYNIFLLSTRAGGLGLNLQCADTVILFDSDWNPQMDIQASHRVHRIGQKNEVFIIRLVTNSVVEEMILEKANYKLGLDQIFIQSGLFNQKSTEKERNEQLGKILKQTADLKNKKFDIDDKELIQDDQEINELISRNETEYKAFEEIDQQRYENDRDLISKHQTSMRFKKKGGYKTKNYRFIKQVDIPNLVKKPIPKKKSKEKQQYGRGFRARQQISYDNDYFSMLDEELELDTIQSNDDDRESQKEEFSPPKYSISKKNTSSSKKASKKKQTKVEKKQKLKKLRLLSKVNNNSSPQERSEMDENNTDLDLTQQDSLTNNQTEDSQKIIEEKINGNTKKSQSVSDSLNIKTRSKIKNPLNISNNDRQSSFSNGITTRSRTKRQQ